MHPGSQFGFSLLEFSCSSNNHGGKFNGVNCMDKSNEIFDNAGTLLAEMHDPALETMEGIQQTVEDYNEFDTWEAILTDSWIKTVWNLLIVSRWQSMTPRYNSDSTVPKTDS
jgi:hypothetical protein